MRLFGEEYSPGWVLISLKNFAGVEELRLKRDCPSDLRKNCVKSEKPVKNQAEFLISKDRHSELRGFFF